MKRWVSFLISGLLLLLLAGCSGADKKGADGGGEQAAAEAYVYQRNTQGFALAEDANQYMLSYDDGGFYYFVMGEGYQFFRQTYDGKEAVPFCEVAEGSVRSFCGDTNGSGRFAVLCAGDEACILAFDGKNTSGSKIVLEERFNNFDNVVKMRLLPDGGYVVAMAEEAYVLDAAGRIENTVKLEGGADKLISAGAEGVFAVLGKSGNSGDKPCIARLDTQKGRAEKVRELPENVIDVFSFEDGFLEVYNDKCLYSQTGGEDAEVLIDLDKQGILASQIRYIYGSLDAIRIVSLDEQSREGYLITLTKSDGQADADGEARPQEDAAAPDRAQEELYTEDGRRIVQVAIPENYYFQMEFHAKKYNQISDNSYVEVTRFKGSLEDHLGKGNRPDIILLNDDLDIPEYVSKNAIEDIAALALKQDKYTLDGVIPKAREILSAGKEGKMYALGTMFRLLRRSSDGTEYDANGKCDSVSYLKWYDQYLSDHEIEGAGDLRDFMRAQIPAFINEDEAQASFASDAFKALMAAYKDTLDHHRGDHNTADLSANRKYFEIEIARGPFFAGGYNTYALMYPNGAAEGVPGTDGENHVFIRLEYPMCIMSTSECKEEALDFVMYYCRIGDHLMRGDSESSYGKGACTEGRFSIFEDNMKEQIYESPRPYMSTDEGDFFYTDEQVAHLKAMIDSAVPETRAQRDIYAMLEEEMDAYLAGSKDLDSACDILQNRAQLYLQERK